METKLKTHPWIAFEIDTRHTTGTTWLALGEAQSKCEHLAGVPLRPAIAKKLHEIYLAKGIHATAAIEGNTLSEGQVYQRIKGRKDLPQSQEYLGAKSITLANGARVPLAFTLQWRSRPWSNLHPPR